MAGAGYKLFNTGDVLTAAQVNTYLMEQTVMVFADAAARTTALSGVVSEGMLSYLKDTNAVEVYDGSNWVSSDDPNAIQNSIINAKGDLIAGSANDTPAILSAGSNYAVLEADSGESTGLKWVSDWTTWTPTYFNLTVGNGTVTSKYYRTGKTVHVFFQLVFGSTTSITGTYPGFALPFTAKNLLQSAIVVYSDFGTGDFVGQMYTTNNSTSVNLMANNAGGTYTYWTPLSATVPHTWATNDRISTTFTYEVQ